MICVFLTVYFVTQKLHMFSFIMRFMMNKIGSTHIILKICFQKPKTSHTHTRFYIHLPAQRRLPREFQERSALYVHLLHFKLSPLLCLCISLRSSPLCLFLPASSLQKVLGNSVNNQVRRPFVERGGRRQSRC